MSMDREEAPKKRWLVEYPSGMSTMTAAIGSQFCRRTEDGGLVLANGDQEIVAEWAPGKWNLYKLEIR